jgi:glycosyltransferase involved in cell wall biosynthesis
MTQTSVVSVVVPTRNSAATLEAALRSVREQTYPAIELIVVDNASSDDTAAIAARYADAVYDRGPERSAQRNFGVARSAGEYLLMLDSDMILERDVIARCIEVIEDLESDAVVVPERTIGNSLLAKVRAVERECYVGDSDIEAARFFKRSAFEEAGGYDELLSAGEDWDLPARIKGAGGRVVRADGVWVLHDEGDARLLPHLRKKFYYGGTLAAYARRHPSLARRQLARPAFIREWRVLADRPALGAAVIGLKALEGAAVVSGAVAARFEQRKVAR